MQYCGKIEFGGHILHVFNTLDEPWFQAVEVAKLIDYSAGKTHQMLHLVENDEKMLVNTRTTITSAQSNRYNVAGTSGGNPNMWFLSELGLYNVLSQSRKPIARGWRRIVHQELINLRRSRKKNIIEQFDDWDEELEGIYFDEETGVLMQSVTMPGGDVEQIPVE